MKKAKGDPQEQRPETPSTLRDVILEYRRSANRPSLLTLLQTAKDRGITVTWESLREATDVGRGEAVITPTFIANFIAAYAAEFHPKSVMDPWAGIGSTLIPVVEGCGFPTATGISPSASDLDIARIMSRDTPITWVNSRRGEALPSLNGYLLRV